LEKLNIASKMAVPIYTKYTISARNKLQIPICG